MEERRAALAAWLRDAAGADNLEILAMDKLSGGAIQENWGLKVSVDGTARDWVLRTDAPSGVSTSHGRVEEFALLKAAHEAGVTVPEPLFLNADAELLGKPFYVMERVAGRAEGHGLVRDPALRGEGGDRHRGKFYRILQSRHFSWRGKSCFLNCSSFNSWIGRRFGRGFVIGPWAYHS